MEEPKIGYCMDTTELIKKNPLSTKLKLTLSKILN